jgi:aminoglycoside phosphotransferase (APT) family kinase protein
VSHPAEVAGKIRNAVARLIGPPGEISELRRLTAGATKATWTFRAQVGDSLIPLVLQVSNTASHRDATSLPRVPARNDAALLAAAADAGVPVPPVRAVLTAEFGLGEGSMMDFISGETIPRRILREPNFAALRGTFASQCGQILARVHVMNTVSLPFLEPLDARRQIEIYRAVYESYDIPIPALELALRWAEKHAPAPNRTTVVHGDFRIGNLICGDDRIRAVLDWELACLGDPMQDLGWICVRTWRFGGSGVVGGIGSREDLFAAYERASQAKVDAARVRFWEAWGSVKWAIMCLVKGQAHRQDPAERTVEAFAIGRRMEEPIHDFLEFLSTGD